MTLKVRELGPWLVNSTKPLMQPLAFRFPVYRRLAYIQGPDTNGQAAKALTGGYYIITRAGSGPLETELTIDNPFFQIRSVGAQNDPDGAETMAFSADMALCRIDSARTIGSTRVLSATRIGGGPTPLMVDGSNRWHYVCTYTFKVPSGI